VDLAVSIATQREAIRKPSRFRFLKHSERKSVRTESVIVSVPPRDDHTETPMKRLLFLPLLLCIMLSMSMAKMVVVPDSGLTPQQILKAEQHKATFTIVTRNEDMKMGAGCSATAISEHVLLTAAHCRIPDGKVYLNQTQAPWVHPLEVSETIYDEQDHMLLVLPGVLFKHFIAYDPANYRPIQRNERYYLWGNPGLVPDQYREGYVTGFYTPPIDGEVMLSNRIALLSGPVVGGDSGSAIFAEDGRLVSVLTWGIFDGLFAGGYDLAFTPEQIAQAEGKGSFTYIPDNRPQVTVNVAPAAPVVQPAQHDCPVFLIAVLAVLLFKGREIFLLIGRAVSYVGKCVVRALKYSWRLMKSLGQFLKKV